MGRPPRTRAEHSRDAPGCPAILAAIDGTGSSAAVAEHAVCLAESLRAKLFVVGFVNVAPASRMGVYRRLALAELERDGRSMAKQTKELADESGVECEVWLAWAPLPSRAIVGAAREVEADCIVIGSPGASVVDRLLARALGGTHEKVIRQARCPVLSVR